MSDKAYYKHANRLKGKSVIVFGGTSGIGFATAEAALEYGARVTISGSNEERLSRTVGDLKKAYPELSGNIKGALCDLSQTATLEATLRNLFEDITEGGAKPVNHIVYTAANVINMLASWKDTTAENLYNGVEVRYAAVVLLAKVAPDFMAQDSQGDASITLTGGTGSHKPFHGQGIGGAWASHLEGLVVALAPLLAPHIRINLVCLGAVETPLLRRMIDQRDGFREQIVKSTLVGRIASADDVAEAYLYFMRDRNVTGQIVTTDGGRLLVSGGL